ncbi:MAG: leucyl aminopeptidase family protein [Candidatus Dependentiae bacterium]|jgi:leucyl aminopeptidase
MISLSSKKSYASAAKQAALVFVRKDKKAAALTAEAEAILATLSIDHKTLFKAHQFTGAAGSAVSAVGTKGSHIVPVVFVGIGDLDKGHDANVEAVRRATGTGLNGLRKSAAKEVVLSLPEAGAVGVSRDELVRQVGMVVHLALYDFVEFKTKKEAWEPKVSLLGGKGDEAALKEANIMGGALTQTRTLADTPANFMTPVEFATRAKKMAKAQGLKFTSFDENKAKKMGMGCYYSVTKGSELDGQIAVMEYSCGKKNAPTIALVGKGVCFDTGGINLKPGESQGGMKYDMSGAAAVFGSMQAIAQLKPNVNVVGITPLVENMPDGKASKQEDVVTALNGMTVEIGNTDAEGRLILADALTYVQNEYDPEAIIDIATLTGACAYFLGSFFSGMMTRDDEFAERLSKIGYRMGDKVWRLPLTDEYKPALDSPIADTGSCGNMTYKAGATTAGLFLEKFVEEKRRWVHLDIAGTDSKIPGATYLGRGATGVGVRLMVEFVCSYK